MSGKSELLIDKINAVKSLNTEIKGYKGLLNDKQDKQLLENFISEKISQISSAETNEQLSQVMSSCRIIIKKGKCYYHTNKYCTQTERYLALLLTTHIIGNDPVTDQAKNMLKAMAVKSMCKKAG